MKRCPLCSRTYPDDQNFCFDDGATLDAAAPPAGSFGHSEAPTASYPYRGGAAPTDMMHGGRTAGGRPQGTAPPPQMPYMMTPYATKRSPLPWILAGVGALIIGVFVIIFLASRNPGQTGLSGGPTPDSTPGATPGSSPGSTPQATPSFTPSSTPSGSWQNVSGDGFTISMPGSPSHDEDTVPSAAGPLPIHLYTLSEGYEGFITGYTVYPDYIFSAAKSEDLMDSAQSGAISNVQGEVTSQRSITLDGNPGREIVGSSPSKNIAFTVRIYLVKPRMYMLLYTQYGKDKPISESGVKFLDSFQLTK